MIRIAVVEDDDSCAEDLISNLNRYQQECKEHIETVRFSDGKTFIEEYKPDFDIIFMDIRMPVMNGIKASRLLRERDSSVALVFMTNLPQYALFGYEVGAAYYMIKPVTYEDLARRLKHILDRIERSHTACITITEKMGMRRVLLKDITYIESLGHWCTIHCADGAEYKKLIPLKKLEEEISGNGFLRCNNSYLVNVAWVDGWNKNEVSVNGETVPISRARKKSFTDALTRFFGEV